MFTWERRNANGYECSSRGDSRGSAFGVYMPDGRTLEAHYQCDVKGYDPGGTNWRLGKGKPGLDPSIDLWQAYLGLWRTYYAANPGELQAMRERIGTKRVLTDCFASTPTNQAHAHAVLLNELENQPCDSSSSA